MLARQLEYKDRSGAEAHVRAASTCRVSGSIKMAGTVGAWRVHTHQLLVLLHAGRHGGDLTIDGGIFGEVGQFVSAEDRHQFVRVEGARTERYFRRHSWPATV